MTLDDLIVTLIGVRRLSEKHGTVPVVLYDKESFRELPFLAVTLYNGDDPYVLIEGAEKEEE